MELPRGFDFNACSGVVDGGLLQTEEVDLTRSFSFNGSGKFLCSRRVYYTCGD